MRTQDSDTAHLSTMLGGCWHHKLSGLQLVYLHTVPRILHAHQLSTPPITPNLAYNPPQKPAPTLPSASRNAMMTRLHR